MKTVPPFKRAMTHFFCVFNLAHTISISHNIQHSLHCYRPINFTSRWSKFCSILEKRACNNSLKSPQEIEFSVQKLTVYLEQAATEATSNILRSSGPTRLKNAKAKLTEKCNPRKKWQTTCYSNDKSKFKQSSKNLRSY